MQGRLPYSFTGYAVTSCDLPVAYLVSPPFCPPVIVLRPRPTFDLCILHAHCAIQVLCPE
jgi:hypothetical protein